MLDNLFNANAWAANKLDDAAGYLGSGWGLMIGNMPHAKTEAGHTIYTNFGGPTDASGFSTPGSYRRAMNGGNFDAIPGMTGMGKAMTGLTIGFTGVNIAAGVYDGGLSGGFQYGMWDLAVHSAVSRKIEMGYVKNAKIGKMINISGLGFMGNLTGASIGAELGWQTAGYPGMFAGAVMGTSAPGWAAMAAMAAVGGTAYAGGQVLKAGYRHKQSQKMIDTAGDMSSFMTRGAMTMRGRAVQAIHKSHLNARSALGMEAGFMHQPARNYHSAYRRSY